MPILYDIINKTRLIQVRVTVWLNIIIKLSAEPTSNIIIKLSAEPTSNIIIYICWQVLSKG